MRLTVVRERYQVLWKLDAWKDVTEVGLPGSERAPPQQWHFQQCARRARESAAGPTYAFNGNGCSYSLRRESSNPRLLQFLFGNSLTNRLTPYFFASHKFLIKILSSFVIILVRKRRQQTITVRLRNGVIVVIVLVKILNGFCYEFISGFVSAKL